MKSFAKLPRALSQRVRPSQQSHIAQDGVRENDQVEDAVELTDLDKLYLALAETDGEHHFNTLYYTLGIASIKALKKYSAKVEKNILPSDQFYTMKHKICDRHFNFQQLAQKYQRSNIVETCSKRGIPVIKKEDVTVVKFISWGPYAGLVFEAQWTRPNGVKEKVCLRHGVNVGQQFLLEAEMSTILRQRNILALHGVIIASSFSPSVALVVEFAVYGNLHESSAQRSVERLCRFTIQTATALEFLESKKIVHQSVKSYNCLVISKDQVKLAGLGNCEFETKTKYTQKAVVYQFAKLFSAYFARYEELTPEMAVLAKNIKSLGMYGPLCPPHFCEVFHRCLSPNPDARPSFTEIRQSLVAQKYASKVRVIDSFRSESAEFISCQAGELITLIAKDRHRKDNTAWLGETEDRKIGFFKSERVQELAGYSIMNDPSVPQEIRDRGPRAEHAFRKAMQTGKVKVYRGRIMLLGQDRAGKTSLKKSLLGLPFDPEQESTVGVEVDPSKCEIEVDQVKNWAPSERKKLEVSEFVEDIARLIAKDLSETEADDKDTTATESHLEEAQINGSEKEDDNPEHSASFPAATQPASDTHEKSEFAEEDRPSENGPVGEGQTEKELQLNIDTEVLPNYVTDLVVRHLQNLRLEDDIKAKEVILTLWDFAGQHLYYASHSVFLSERAVYVLVYNLNKNLLAKAEPCVRQGIHDIVLDNPNNETNLDNLLSWLVSVHNIRSGVDDADKNLENQGTKLPYLRPPVIIVGTNADQPFETTKAMEKRIKKSISDKTYVKHVITPFFAVNNKDKSDRGVQKLRQKIMEVLKDEPYMGEEVPLRWFNFERVVEALVAKQTYYIDLDHLLHVIRQVCRIEDEEETTAMLNFYHDLGVIVKHGRTVVLQAQWLIDLFKQLITVRPFDEADPFFLECWKELEENGILRMALVDHVFADFIRRGLFKQDILDMMELYGLMAKFSPGVPAENEHKQRYFVPTQLKSSPLGLCEIKPSECDPCPLYVHFLDGFVPHGLFPQFVSRCISWCPENGISQTPQLFNNGVRLFVGKQIIFDLILICRKRFINVVLKRRNSSSAKPSSTFASNKMALEVRSFIERTLEGLSHDLSWLRNLRYELSVACTHCVQSSQSCSMHGSVSCGHDDCLHLLRLPCGEELICPKSFSEGVVSVPGLEKWLKVQNSQIEEQKMEVSEAEVFDQTFSFKSGSPLSDDVLLIAHELGTSWKMVGRVLNVPDAVLEQIEEDEPKLFERCYCVLRRWKETFGSAATYQCLAQALQHPIVSRPQLAAKYCGVHASIDTGTGLCGFHGGKED